MNDSCLLPTFPDQEGFYLNMKFDVDWPRFIGISVKSNKSKSVSTLNQVGNFDPGCSQPTVYLFLLIYIDGPESTSHWSNN